MLIVFKYPNTWIFEYLLIVISVELYDTDIQTEGGGGGLSLYLSQSQTGSV